MSQKERRDHCDKSLQSIPQQNGKQQEFRYLFQAQSARRYAPYLFETVPQTEFL